MTLSRTAVHKRNRSPSVVFLAPLERTDQLTGAQLRVLLADRGLRKRRRPDLHRALNGRMVRHLEGDGVNSYLGAGAPRTARLFCGYDPGIVG